MQAQSEPVRLPTSLIALFAALCFSAFLTELKFVPGIPNNIGFFEVFVGITALLFALGIYGRQRVVLHPLTGIMLLIVGFGTLSIAVAEPARFFPGLIQLTVLVSLTIFLIVIHNLIERYQVPPELLLRLIVSSILFVFPWILYSQVSSGNINAAGLFRGRAHMGTYMLTGFWLSAVLAAWPGLARARRLAAILSGLCALYCVAVSGRRSVYFSIILGLALLAAALIMSRRINLVRALGMITVGVAFIVILYRSELSPQLEFFQHRIHTVDDQIRNVLESDEEDAEGFLADQNRGVRKAFRESPLIGIGWGGYARTRFSADGTEVHSTPLRFLVEMGIIGLALYVALMATLLFRSVKFFVRMRDTPHASSYLIMAIAVWSLSISYIYNRQITERVFWLLLGVLFSLERFATTYTAAAIRVRPTSLSRTVGQPKGGR